MRCPKCDKPLELVVDRKYPDPVYDHYSHRYPLSALFGQGIICDGTVRVKKSIKSSGGIK